ncbi:YbaB/EbfC family nucleoid-associated protein [Oecophyllibacter saccharovorans]|uniref:Nucleoid-associated protein E3202_06525 n=1 Tax=Oecophyllibacter saccharovorans TaxID=2558360 RepID=A0A506ULP5_9PROT|nr:YbaB/EbfC family nucleoid-associated protein [Oecophyllibacter saccharovorans]QDH15339.1 YbaB/EbfC family nucleoid-associated protein [Oecophyllibacter saccharovorans]TPW34172.1 YbaB/EbfC family nucleoid-associated protein [Oecophyllibacter saccharovorans]TPW36356.1 YbaB/EbfC family nucleoid-associated protein [Oecophyllibacter saccharovorans]
MKNLAGMMKQAAQMQTRMKEAQDRLAAMEVEGEAGNGLVRARMTGKGVLKDIHIAPELADPQDLETLQDLIVAACADARKKSEAAGEEEMKKVTGGLNLPPGLDLPF